MTQGLTGLGRQERPGLEYAHRCLAAEDIDLAWWFTAEDRSVLVAAMSRLYDRLTGTAGSGEDAEIGAAALRNWLEHGPYRWLVVFDTTPSPKS